MSAVLEGVGVTVPVLAAPMAGGPSTPELVVAAGGTGSLGFLAGGYRTAAQLAADIAAVRQSTGAFGVNLFVPNPVPVDPVAYRNFAAEIAAEGERYGLDLAGSALREDDDGWGEKIGLLLTDPVPMVSFTFGLPKPGVVAALRRLGSVTVQTVTSAAEGEAAAAIGVDMLVVQGAGAGGHSATLTPDAPPPAVPLVDLVGQIRERVRLPVIAAGGVATRADAADVVRSGADAVMVGTALLRTAESGASATYKAALTDKSAVGTVVTRAFSGRPARAVRNLFIDAYDSAALSGYPAVHHLTSPLRKAAAAAGDAERINIWAGAGYAHAQEGDVAGVIAGLAAGL